MHMNQYRLSDPIRVHQVQEGGDRTSWATTPSPGDPQLLPDLLLL